MTRDPDVGDTVNVVVIHPNQDNDRDPVGKIDGKTAFLRFNEKGTNEAEFGETYTGTIADEQENNYVVTVNQ